MFSLQKLLEIFVKPSKYQMNQPYQRSTNPFKHQPPSQPPIQPTQQKRLSFNSLSKNKDKKFMMIKSNKPNLSPSKAYKNKQNTNFNEENSHYDRKFKIGIFKEIVNQIGNGRGQKNGIGKDNVLCREKEDNLGYQEYYGTRVCGNLGRSKVCRPQSRHKIQKYFPSSPSIIRTKYSSPQHHINRMQNSARPTNSHILAGKTANTHTFPPNEYFPNQTKFYQPQSQLLPQVNTSRASIKFDMSPCFNL